VHPGDILVSTIFPFRVAEVPNSLREPVGISDSLVRLRVASRDVQQPLLRFQRSSAGTFALR
jgi:hypothetical protein